MNLTLPTGWPGRLLALALLIVVIATVYFSAAVPLIDFYGERESVAETQAGLLRRLNTIAAELPRLRTRVAALRAGVDSSGLTLPGASDALAAAWLQSYLEPIAATAGMTIGSTEILPAEAEGDYRRVGLRVIVSGSYDALLELLGAAETGKAPLIVDSLQIRTLERRLGRDRDQSPDLNASLDLYGFRVGTEAARQ